MERTVVLLIALCLAVGCLGGDDPGTETPAATASPKAPATTTEPTKAPAATAETTATPAATAEPTEAPVATEAPPTETVEPTEVATPTPSPLEAALEAAKDVTRSEGDNVITDYCDAWMKSSWADPPVLDHAPEVYATKVTPETGMFLIEEKEYLDGRTLTKCDCRVYLKYLSRVADSEVRADFTADTDCSAWSHAYGCKILCYGDTEEECKTNHNCA
ncbi:MAG: hypothetical protein QGG50_00120 [Methanopyri archaeon]|jgi:hypothetical protein|nr:hypothetical protein [Methanopyri archaeon]